MKQALPKNTPPLKSSASALDKNQKRDSERPLVEDIRLLGRILGDVIREQEGERVVVPWHVHRSHVPPLTCGRVPDFGGENGACVVEFES